MYPYKIKDDKTVEVACVICGDVKTIEVGEEGLKRLQEGNMLIQRAIPHVVPELREMLLSGTCPECFKNMFSFMDEDDENDYDGE